MQKLRSICFIAAMIGAASASAAPLAYTLDPAHTQVLFSWSHLGFSHPTGQFDQVDGALVYDAGHPAQSSVHVRIPVTSLHTHVPALDKQLLEAQFLDAKKIGAVLDK